MWWPPSPSSVYRVLREAGVLRRWNGKPSRKARDSSNRKSRISIGISTCRTSISAGRFITCVVYSTGFSRAIVHWDIRESMKEAEVEVILQRACESYPEARPRIISDNGPQFLAKDFKEYIRFCGMTHVKTSPYYPQSNGKIERLAQVDQVGVHSQANPLFHWQRPNAWWANTSSITTRYDCTALLDSSHRRTNLKAVRKTIFT